MALLFDSFRRAAAYCLLPRVILLSLLPLAATVLLAACAGYAWWTPAVGWTRGLLEDFSWTAAVLHWLQAKTGLHLQSWLAPLLVLLAAVPLVVLLNLLAVALWMTPALGSFVARRRFPHLQRRHGASFLQSLAWSLGSTVLAFGALLVSLPLWLVPPLVLVLPPLIWGWLTYRVMAFDALATHASVEERLEIFRRHRSELMLIGIACGYLGAAPAVVWASGALFAAAFFVLVPVAIWIYTMVFVFSSLWFLHYALAALDALRAPGGAGARIDA